jgi:hypothetical protein
MATSNAYSDSLLMDALRGSLSNAESFGRGFAVAPVGLLGDIEGLLRKGVNFSFGRGGVNVGETPVLPTTEGLLSNIPRMTPRRMETAGMEQIGSAANPRGPINLGRAVASLPSDVARAGKEFLAVGQPARVVAYHGTNAPEVLSPKSNLNEMYDRTGFTGWFSESPELANYYSLARGVEGGAVMPVDLNIKNPLRLNFDMNDSPEEAMKIAEKLGLDRDFFPSIYSDKNKRAFEVVNNRIFKQAAQEAGYDAIQIPEEGVMTFAPLIEEGGQVKSLFDVKSKGLLD